VIQETQYANFKKFQLQIQSMTVPRAYSATTVYPLAVSTSNQDFLVMGGDNTGFKDILYYELIAVNF
jgi:hypothetical protein